MTLRVRASCARHRGLVLAGERADLRERHLLRIVAGEAQAIARRQRRNGGCQHGAHRRDEARAIRIDGRSTLARSGAGRALVGQRLELAGFAMPIDEALRDERSQPRREAAAAVEVAEDGLADAVLLLQPEELGVQRLRDLARAAAGIDGVRGADTSPGRNSRTK